MGEKFLEVVQVNEIFEKLLPLFSLSVSIESIPIDYSLGKFVASDLYSNLDVPPFDKSLVDGFAVNYSEVKGTSASNPIVLSFQGEVKIGEEPNIKLSKGMTAFVPTGGYLPHGSNSVVMKEYADALGDSVFVMRDVACYENVLLRGVDLRKGELVLRRGERITANVIGFIKSAGITSVSVYRPIKVGIFSTGDELSETHPLPHGKIYDYNRITLMSMCLEDGFSPTDYGIVKDDPDEIFITLRRAIEENDFVMLSGGTSKGNFDFTVSTINSLGTPGVVIHGLNVSPGKPTIFGVVDEKLVAGLSGNPLAAALTYRIVVRDLIAKKVPLLFSRIYLAGELTENVPSKKGRSEIVIGKLDITEEKTSIVPIFSDSSFVSAISKGDGFFMIPFEKEGLYRGEKVKFELW